MQIIYHQYFALKGLMAQVIGTYCSCFLIFRELMKAMADNENNLFDRQILKLRRARAKS